MLRAIGSTQFHGSIPNAADARSESGPQSPSTVTASVQEVRSRIAATETELEKAYVDNGKSQQPGTRAPAKAELHKSFLSTRSTKRGTTASVFFQAAHPRKNHVWNLNWDASAIDSIARLDAEYKSLQKRLRAAEETDKVHGEVADSVDAMAPPKKKRRGDTSVPSAAAGSSAMEVRLRAGLHSEHAATNKEAQPAGEHSRSSVSQASAGFDAPIIVDGVEIRRVAGDDPASRNFNEAVDCFIKLFGPKTEEEHEARYRRSKEDVDFYITRNFTAGDAPSGAIRDLMIALDVATHDLLDAAYRYGPGNLLIRHPLGEEEAESIGAVDIDATLRRSALEHLALTSHEQLWRQVNRPSQSGQKEVQADATMENTVRAAITLIACDMLVGTASCTGYSNLLALMAAELCAQDKWRALGKITIRTVAEPTLRERSVDHVQLVVEIRDQEDQDLFTIACNPWGSAATPLALKDSVYKDGKEFLKFGPGEPVPPYKRWIYQDMQEAKGSFEDVIEQPAFQAWVEDELLKLMDEEEDGDVEQRKERQIYSLDNSLDGYVDHQALSAAEPGVALPRPRLQTYLNAGDSPLAELLYSSMQI